MLIRLCAVFQKYNADYDLSAKEGADTLAFVSLLEEKLLPALVSPERLLLTLHINGSVLIFYSAVNQSVISIIEGHWELVSEIYSSCRMVFVHR